MRIDYLSPTLYLTDILVAGIMGSWVLNRLKFKVQSVSRRTEFKIKKKKVEKTIIVWSLLLIFVALNISFSASPWLAVYKWLKAVEFVLLGYYVAKNIWIFEYLSIWLLSITVFYSSLLAIGQFIHQGSLGGWLWLLGERSFTSSTPGIAQTIINGRLLLRPYATFPHPNVLAGYLVVVTTIISARLFCKARPCKPAWWGLAIVIFLAIGVLGLTFSRSAWLVGLLSLTYFFARTAKSKLQKFTLFLLISVIVYGCMSLFSPLSESVIIRNQLSNAALQMFFASPIFGVGLGNFITRLPDFIQLSFNASLLQPAHDIYLLIGAETGVVGLGLFLWFIWQTYQRSKIKDHPSADGSKIRKINFSVYHLALTQILILGLFDHYFVTLQQTQLLFAIMGGMAWGKSQSS